MSSFTVPEDLPVIRVDSYLSQQLGIPRNKVQQIIKKGRVWLGTSIITKPSRLIHTGDLVTVTEGWNTISFPPAEDLPLNIIYEDDCLMVLDKPAGQVVHPVNKEGRGTLVNALLFHRPEIRQAVYDPENQVSLLRPGIVHRLDKETSGVMVVAKTGECMIGLSKQFQNHNVQKEYRALLYGLMPDRSDIHTSLRRQKKGNISRMKSQRELKEGREARSTFTPIANYSYLSKPITEANIEIATGRTHQIRSHSRYIGHPILGDRIYGTASAVHFSDKMGIKRQMLHAAKLTFFHPLSHEEMRFESPLPQDYLDTLSKLS